jgi:hypothetical protein
MRLDLLRMCVAEYVNEAQSQIAQAVTPHVLKVLRSWEDSGWEDVIETHDELLGLGLGTAAVVKLMKEWQRLRQVDPIRAVRRAQSLIDDAMRVRYLRRWKTRSDVS